MLRDSVFVTSKAALSFLPEEMFFHCWHLFTLCVFLFSLVLDSGENVTFLFGIETFKHLTLALGSMGVFFSYQLWSFSFKVLYLECH